MLSFMDSHYWNAGQVVENPDLDWGGAAGKDGSYPTMQIMRIPTFLFSSGLGETADIFCSVCFTDLRSHINLDTHAMHIVYEVITAGHHLWWLRLSASMHKQHLV